MPSLAWWLLHAAQSTAMVLAIAFAMLAARRAGGHTLYGNLLFLLALGFLSLLFGEALFAGRQAMDAWEGPGSFNDLFNLGGWLILWAAILLFVERFSPVRRPRGMNEQVRLFLFMAVPLVLMLALFRTVLSPPGADPDATLRSAYLVIDALTIGALLGGLDRFMRLRKGALGRLYLFLGAAILFKTGGDLYWASLAARDGTSLYATASYPVAGLLAVVGLGMHLRHMRTEALSETLPRPWLRPQQQHLAGLARRLQGVAGGYAARTALMAAGAALERHGTDWRIEGMTVEADATAEAWQAALDAADHVAQELVGESGQSVVSEMAEVRPYR